MQESAPSVIWNSLANEEYSENPVQKCLRHTSILQPIYNTKLWSWSIHVVDSQVEIVFASSDNPLDQTYHIPSHTDCLMTQHIYSCDIWTHIIFKNFIVYLNACGCHTLDA